MTTMIGFPEKTDGTTAGAWIVSKTRKLADGRFEAAAALFSSDPSQDHKGGIRCNQIFAIAGSRSTAERRVLRAMDSGSALRLALVSGEVSHTPAA